MNLVWTASEIAPHLAVKRQAVDWMLRNVTPDGHKVVRGATTRAWSYMRFPAPLQVRLDKAAEERGFRNGEHLLSTPPEPWKASVPFADCTADYQSRALKLKAALAVPLERRNDPALSPGELVAIGCQEYRQAFGNAISPRRWNELLYRTLERAGASEDFSRPELYLDERPARRVEPVALVPVPEGNYLADLRLAIERCGDVSNLSATKRQYLLHYALEAYQAALGSGRPPRKVAKEEIFDLLIGTGIGLARSRNALRVKFARAYDRWISQGEDPAALQDGRIEDAKTRRKDLPEEDRDTILSRAVFDCGGRKSQAWRECRLEGLLTEATVSRFIGNPSRKSYTPKAVLREITPHVDTQLEMYRAPKHARDNGAYLYRNWDKVPSLDWHCMDDATLPVYYWVPDGKDWFTLMPGQFLLSVDCRSTAVLGFSLLPERNYNARVIRTLITHVFDEYGLPRKGFYFERGIWESSRILKGDRNAGAVEWPGVELGLREFGLRFVHATRARSKPVERVIGALQNQMERDPGYCGRDEILNGYEEFKRMKQLVESRKLDPREKFYSQADWRKRLHEISTNYNEETQEGRHTKGLSPADALHAFRAQSDPPVRFDARCRYLLAHHKMPKRVTANGITIHLGKQVFNYKNSELGEHRNEMVLAWFNPETPEILTVTDMNREVAFCVERSQEVPAMDAPADLMAQELERIAAFNRPTKALYQILKAKHDVKCRLNLVNSQTIELGQQIESGKRAISQKEDLQTKAARAYGRLGAALPEDVREDQVSSMNALNRLFQEEGEEKQ